MPPFVDRAPYERNLLLAALPHAEYEDLVPQLAEVRLANSQPLAVRGQAMRHVFFPRDAVVSIVVSMEDGQMVEGATIGHEGMVGLAAFLADGVATDDAFCQVPGEAARMDIAAFCLALERGGRLRRVLQRYTLALMGQLARTAGCNRLHPMEERLARWLLMTHDRVGADEFPLTHEFIAAMLGVRRPPVTVAAGMLQQAGLIRYHRGRIRILDRERLQDAACEDYRLTQALYADLFRGIESEPPD